jgi:hypothetical protein
MVTTSISAPVSFSNSAMTDSPVFVEFWAAQIVSFVPSSFVS